MAALSEPSRTVYLGSGISFASLTDLPDAANYFHTHDREIQLGSQGPGDLRQ